MREPASFRQSYDSALCILYIGTNTSTKLLEPFEELSKEKADNMTNNKIVRRVVITYSSLRGERT